MIDDLVARAKVASEEFMKLDQETVNNIIKEMAMAALSNHMPLARLAVEETKRGIYEDKIIKNMFFYPLDAYKRIRVGWIIWNFKIIFLFGIN